jgi:hypothetical protein
MKPYLNRSVAVVWTRANRRERGRWSEVENSFLFSNFIQIGGVAARRGRMKAKLNSPISEYEPITRDV